MVYRTLPRCLGLLALFLAPWNFLLPVCAQNGDRKEKPEQQVSLVPREMIPHSPPLAPAQALSSFQLQPGFRIELFASEPMVETPVALAFDPEGRVWVAEMRGFMPSVDGTGEGEPVGRVSILEDTDNDGRADRKTVFLDQLVMPRAICLVRNGILIAEPPRLWFCRDTNGDGACDDKIEVAGDYAPAAEARNGRRANIEHAANGLLLALDNWIYSANHTVRFRNAGGTWERATTTGRGQWGLAQDDFGRLFFNSNQDQLRGDSVPGHYVARRPGTKFSGLNARVAGDQTVFPARVNPGVNRGYRKGILRTNGTLARFTAACGPHIYRGNQFPAAFHGNAFVCEPAGNLVKRNILTEQDGVVTAQPAYTNAEFLASTDERFRPVNLATGPDGALYVVDMYHGIIQHRVFVTSYLRQQILERGLDRPLYQGRIYRVVHEGKPRGAQPALARARSPDWVQALHHANGWWRDTAQRLLVERNDPDTVPALQAASRAAPAVATRLHALWALEGMNRLDPATVSTALEDPHPKVRVAALRLAEPHLGKSTAAEPAGAALRSKLLDLAHDPRVEVQVQLALTLGEWSDDASAATLLTTLRQSAVARVRDAANLSSPRQESTPATGKLAKLVPLTADEQKRFDAGKELYEITCLACHQPTGLGQEGLAPPLAGSEWVAASKEWNIRIVLHGMRGPIKVKGQTYELDMPALGVLDDEQIAAVLTFVRREWGNTAAPVSPDEVKNVRAATAAREEAWSAAELMRVR